MIIWKNIAIGLLPRESIMVVDRVVKDADGGFVLRTRKRKEMAGKEGKDMAGKENSIMAKQTTQPNQPQQSLQT